MVIKKKIKLNKIMQMAVRMLKKKKTIFFDIKTEIPSLLFVRFLKVFANDLTMTNG